MQEIYIRNYGNGNIRYFMSKEEYDKKFNEEIKGLEEELIEQGDSHLIPNEWIDYELVGIIEFDGENCDTIEDAIRELLCHSDTCDVLKSWEDYDVKYNVSKEDVLKNSYLTYKVEGSNRDYFKIVFDIVEEDEDDILESKVKNVRLEII